MRVPARKKLDGFCHNLVLGHATKISTLRSYFTIGIEILSMESGSEIESRYENSAP